MGCVSGWQDGSIKRKNLRPYEVAGWCDRGKEFRLLKETQVADRMLPARARGNYFFSHQRCCVAILVCARKGALGTRNKSTADEDRMIDGVAA